MIRQCLLLILLPFIISCASGSHLSVTHSNVSEQGETDIDPRTFTAPESMTDLKFGNIQLYIQEMNSRKVQVRINKKFDFYEPLYEFNGKWYWYWYLDYPQHRDLNYKSTSYIKVGSVLYQNSTLPFSVLKSGEKIETFPKGFIAKQLLEYRPIPW